METFNVIKKSLVMVFASVIVACGAKTLVAVVFIPALAGDYSVEGVAGYTINLQSVDEGSESGIIDGQESHSNDSNRDGNNFVGTFNGLHIEFTIERQDNIETKYTGKMTPVSNEDHTITKIEMNSTSSSEKLVLIKDSN